MSKTILFDSSIKKYAYREASQIYQDIGASPDGLSYEQVEAMREKYGANSFAERKNDTTIRRLRRAFINPFSIILFIYSFSLRTVIRKTSAITGAVLQESKRRQTI